jgi:hypothetical protein
MLCDVAMARAHGIATFILPDLIAGAGDQSEPMGMPGLPTEVVRLIEQISLKGDVCGRCTSYQYDAEGQPVMPAASCSLRGSSRRPSTQAARCSRAAPRAFAAAVEAASQHKVEHRLDL